ncbi:vWA domain-containing protein [Rubellimicrobium roseum]|uniref:VWA domain-containing protein n=1 Tax=Rubellimicrobium roseum TaxID=687525 RepID=A0A5C4NH97_9RHOB|nr:vWA domain-containing protein [Rubellimicrobium roseum]TNC72406.1 VWA domain-containing protein [Rubellimicrobium roseum]
MTSQPTLVAFLLDRTGSMESVKAQTIEGFNAYLAGLQAEDADIAFSLIQFDSMSIDVLCANAPVKEVRPLTEATYQPRASTPLIDAAVKTIRAVEVAVAGKAVAPKVIVTFQTDGEENCSSEHDWLELNLLIKEKAALGWQFNFLGAGIDAYQQGQRMGLKDEAVVSYAKEDRVATRAMFAQRAARARAFAVGEAADMAIPLEEKRAAGDRYAEAPRTPPQAPALGRRPPRRAIVDKIDLG